MYNELNATRIKKQVTLIYHHLLISYHINMMQMVRPKKIEHS